MRNSFNSDDEQEEHSEEYYIEDVGVGLDDEEQQYDPEFKPEPNLKNDGQIRAFERGIR